MPPIRTEPSQRLAHESIFVPYGATTGSGTTHDNGKRAIPSTWKKVAQCPYCEHIDNMIIRRRHLVSHPEYVNAELQAGGERARAVILATALVCTCGNSYSRRDALWRHLERHALGLGTTCTPENLIVRETWEKHIRKLSLTKTFKFQLRSASAASSGSQSPTPSGEAADEDVTLAPSTSELFFPSFDTVPFPSEMVYPPAPLPENFFPFDGFGNAITVYQSPPMVEATAPPMFNYGELEAVLARAELLSPFVTNNSFLPATTSANVSALYPYYTPAPLTPALSMGANSTASTPSPSTPWDAASASGNTVQQPFQTVQSGYFETPDFSYFPALEWNSSLGLPFNNEESSLFHNDDKETINPQWLLQ